MDAFFASVEQRDDPDLRGRPVLVGGDGPRGVVAAASYEARAFGCRSAQPIAVAKRRCPEAVIVPPRGARYREVSRQVFEIFDRFTPVVQPLNVDKPDGLTVVDESWIRTTLPTMPIARMWGVGPVTETALRGMGIRTFADLAACPPDALERRLGRDAARIQGLARGEDARPVAVDSRSRSVSHEQTFGRDVEDPARVRNVLLGQADAVARRLRAAGARARTVTVKIRYGDFKTITRSCSLPDGTDRSDEIRAAAASLFDRWAEASYQPVRLIGVGAGHLGHDDVQLGLFTAEDDARKRELDRLADEIRGRFGPRVIRRGDAG